MSTADVGAVSESFKGQWAFAERVERHRQFLDFHNDAGRAPLRTSNVRSSQS
jgi:hypothetical protein